MLEKDYLLISRYNQGDEGAAKSLIDKYQQRIFALVLYLVGNDCDKAYNIAASSFVETLRTTSFSRKDDTFLTRLARIAIERSRDVKIIPSSNEPDFADLPPEKRQSLLIVKRALQALPFNEKALLLLRDQLRLSYKDISAILRISGSSARVQTTQARTHLRKKLGEVL